MAILIAVRAASLQRCVPSFQIGIVLAKCASSTIVFASSPAREKATARWATCDRLLVAVDGKARAKRYFLRRTENAWFVEGS
jgi:hypothetical protein